MGLLGSPLGIHGRTQWSQSGESKQRALSSLYQGDGGSSSRLSTGTPVPACGQLMVVAQSVSGRAMRQAQLFTQKSEIQHNLKLEVAAKRLLPHCYAEGYSAAFLDKLKA